MHHYYTIFYLFCLALIIAKISSADALDPSVADAVALAVATSGCAGLVSTTGVAGLVSTMFTVVAF